MTALHNYTGTNPQPVCGRERGSHACSSKTPARRTGALKKRCCQRLLNTRGLFQDFSAQPVPWPGTPFHTWLLPCFQRRPKLSSARTYGNPRAQPPPPPPPAGQTSTHLGEGPALSHSVGCREERWRRQGHSSSQLLLLAVTERKLGRFFCFQYQPTFIFSLFYPFTLFCATFNVCR